MQSTLSLSFPLILASNSPRRREILGQVGFAFSVVASEIDESFPADMPLDEVPVFLSEKKARDRKSTRLNSSHESESRMPSSA